MASIRFDSDSPCSGSVRRGRRQAVQLRRPALGRLHRVDQRPPSRPARRAVDRCCRHTVGVYQRDAMLLCPVVFMGTGSVNRSTCSQSTGAKSEVSDFDGRCWRFWGKANGCDTDGDGTGRTLPFRPNLDRRRSIGLCDERCWVEVGCRTGHSVAPRSSSVRSRGRLTLIEVRRRRRLDMCVPMCISKTPRNRERNGVHRRQLRFDRPG